MARNDVSPGADELFPDSKKREERGLPVDQKSVAPEERLCEVWSRIKNTLMKLKISDLNNLYMKKYIVISCK